MITKKSLIFSCLFNALYPILGVAFFFLHWNVGLYICAGIGAFWSLIRLSNSDIMPIVWIGILAIGTFAVREIFHLGYWPLVCVGECAYMLISFIVDTIKFIRVLSLSKNQYDDDDDDHDGDDDF